jgi:hypothetical protein
MKKIVKIPLIVFGVLVVLFVALMILAGNSTGPLEAPELAGQELDAFLNSPFLYWTGWGGDKINTTDTIAEVFYTGKQADGYSVITPKSLGKKGDATSVVIIIQEDGKPVDSANIMVYLNYVKGGNSTLDHIDQLDNGEKKKLGEKLDEMNIMLISIFPDSFFSEYAAKWETLNQNDTTQMFAEREKVAEESAEKEKSKKTVYTDKQRTAARYNLQESDVKNFFVIDEAHPITDGFDFTGENYFVITGNLKSLELKRADGKGTYFLIDIRDDRGEKIAVSCNFIPGFIDELPTEERKPLADARKKLIWQKYPGDGKYQVFYATSISAGIVIIGLREVK